MTKAEARRRYREGSHHLVSRLGNFLYFFSTASQTYTLFSNFWLNRSFYVDSLHLIAKHGNLASACFVTGALYLGSFLDLYRARSGMRRPRSRCHGPQLLTCYLLHCVPNGQCHHHRGCLQGVATDTLPHMAFSPHVRPTHTVTRTL